MTKLPLPPGSLLNVAMVELADLCGLDVVEDVLTVLPQRVRDAEHEWSAGPLGGKGPQAIPAEPVQRARRWVIADAQECHGHARGGHTGINLGNNKSCGCRRRLERNSAGDATRAKVRTRLQQQ